MQITPQQFRTTFPAFVNPSCFHDAEIKFWAALAEKLHNADRWGDLLEFGVQLFIAHNLAIDFNNTKASRLGQAPGVVQGAITSGSVDKVSYSRDTQSVMEPNAGHWNLTTFGLRYRRLVLMVGAGPVHVGPSAMGTQVGVSASAWPGVVMPYG